MAGYARPSGALAQNPAGDPQAGIGNYPPEQDRSGEYDGQQYTGRGSRTDKQTGGADVGQHTDEVPQQAESDHGTTIAGVCTRSNRKSCCAALAPALLA
ncbi:hypothetical protein ACNAW0_30255 [Micromonospora sp. SL1-18]|uniref:hypothetical protein n=1 Tax=Micromonospora sp. SL1-18 TaxID=3399128 RepID=UPI003A4DA9CB